MNSSNESEVAVPPVQTSESKLSKQCLDNLKSEPAASVARRQARKEYRLFKRDDTGREMVSEAPGWREKPSPMK